MSLKKSFSILLTQHPEWTVCQNVLSVRLPSNTAVFIKRKSLLCYETHLNWSTSTFGGGLEALGRKLVGGPLLFDKVTTQDKEGKAWFYSSQPLFILDIKSWSEFLVRTDTVFAASSGLSFSTVRNAASSFVFFNQQNQGRWIHGMLEGQGKLVLAGEMHSIDLKPHQSIFIHLDHMIACESTIQLQNTKKNVNSEKLLNRMISRIVLPSPLKVTGPGIVVIGRSQKSWAFKCLQWLAAKIKKPKTL